MDLLKAFAHFIDTEKLFRKNDVLLLAVSGGVDSIVLCELCRQSGFQFIIAHCNFRLRGDESERDEKFVRSLGEQYQAPVVVKKFDTEAYASGKKISIQVAARELRYEWFHSLLGTPITTPAGDIRPSVLLTAHHADDNIETVLMNFYKGTGIQGLRGILPKQGKLVRPLLFATKKELQQFAQENNLDYVTDSSNLSDKYTRNYFRHQVIPLISKLLPEAEENMAGNIIRFRETAELYEQAINLYKKKLLEPKGENLEVPVLKLLQQKPLHTIVYEIIKDYGFSSKQTAEAVALLQSDTGKFILSPTHRILKNRNRLIISPLTEEKSNIILIDEKDTTVYFEEGRLLIDIKDIKPGTEVNQDPATAVLDARDIRFPLLLRKWKPGDYFYPLGMQKKKKLARFFIDNKLSLADKEKTWVIESGKKIIWVVGQRIDDRFKVTEKTKRLLTISVKPLTQPLPKGERGA